jgi:hypothetical protein
MPSGTLGQSAPSATSNTIVYTVPANRISTLNINICNRDAVNVALIRIAIANTSSPAVAEYIEYDAPVPPNSVLERTGIVASNSKNVVVYTSISSISVNVHGFEE